MQNVLSPPRQTAGSPPWLRLVVERLLGLPLFYKVLVANCTVVLLGVGLGTWFTLGFVAAPSGGLHWEAVALMSVVGFGVTVVINAVVLTWALQPLHALERIVDRVANGDFSARAHRVTFSDPDVERLGDTLNLMLDAIVHDRAQLQKLSEQVLAAQEDERKRIARELHDETAQSLTTLLIHLKMLERARDPDQLQAQIGGLRDLTVQTLEEVRALAVELRPTTLDNLGLLAALEAYTESYAARMPVRVEFGVEGMTEADRLPPQVELVLYRVVQEALTNVAKHAGAERIWVRLRQLPTRVVAEIVDNGRGFDVDAVMHSRERGLGLFGMQERLALVGGTLVIESERGHGTRIEASVPLSQTPRLRVDET